jgi:hypothetical protein
MINIYIKYILNLIYIMYDAINYMLNLPNITNNVTYYLYIGNYN